ncbi:MAG: type II secretion system F family protein [Angustibacter sp.]
MNSYSILAGLAIFCAGLLLRRPGRAASRPPPARRLAKPRVIPPVGEPLPVATLMELTSAALLAGVPAAHAIELMARLGAVPDDLGLAAAARAMSRGRPIARAWAPVDPQFIALGQALALAEISGCALGPILLTSARQLRQQRATLAQSAARRLGVKLSLPLGLTTLPAFIFLGVIPVIFGLAQPVLFGG